MVFKASGILYSNGETIGLSKTRLDFEDLEGVVKRSPKRIPLVNSFSCHWRDPDNVIGFAELEYVTDKGNPHIDAHLTFNSQNADIYSEAISKDPKSLRLGFLIKDFTKKSEYLICDGKIWLIALSPYCLGGYLYSTTWCDEGYDLTFSFEE